MVTKSSILGLIAALAVVLIAVSAVGENADSQVPKIGTVEESGFSQSCVEAGCYTPMIATVDVGGVVTMTNTDPTGVHTFTSGTVNGFTPSPDGVFDSGVLMSGDSFEWEASLSQGPSGTIVTMTNTDTTGVHTFTSGTVDGFTPIPDGMFDSEVLMPGDAYERKFSQKGTFDYYCILHTWMTGQIIVE